MRYFMNGNCLKVISVALILIFPVSCASYKAVSIPKLQPDFATNSQKLNNVTCSVKVFTQDDCRRYFDKNIIEEGYQPIQIAIDNESRNYYLLSKNGISLPTVSPEEVAQKAHRSTVGRAAGYGVAGIFIWPLLIPAVVDGAKSSKSNTQMDIDFAAKGIQDSVIQPFTTIDGVIFVPTSEFKTNLTINIVNKETQEKMSFVFNSIE